MHVLVCLDSFTAEFILIVLAFVHLAPAQSLQSSSQKVALSSLRGMLTKRVQQEWLKEYNRDIAAHETVHTIWYTSPHK